MADEVLVFALGATAFQKYDENSGTMKLGLRPEELLEAAVSQFPQTKARLKCAFPYRSGAELTFDVLLEVAVAILSEPNSGFVLVCGTDTLEEAAFALHLMLGLQLQSCGKTLVVTGAMLPADALSSDGPTNLRDAIQVAAGAGGTGNQGSPADVLVVMNSCIHLGRYVTKADSQLLGAFRSHPGPIGQLRGGVPVWSYAPPRNATALCLPTDAIDTLHLGKLKTRVAIWPLAVSAFLPEALLQELDGLVLAASGTGSVPASLVNQLSPAWTSRLPVVIVSRCSVGANHDCFLYRGSRDKYESRGFILGDGYEHLNPLQARTLMVLRLSTLGCACAGTAQC